jgi:hypothetical protein
LTVRFVLELVFDLLRDRRRRNHADCQQNEKNVCVKPVHPTKTARAVRGVQGHVGIPQKNVGLLFTSAKCIKNALGDTFASAGGTLAALKGAFRRLPRRRQGRRFAHDQMGW